MAVTSVLTGSAQTITATNGSQNIAAASTAGWVNGATIQGAGIPAGTRLGAIVANVSAKLVDASGNAVNFTGATGAVSVIVSSNNATLTITAAASGDTANPVTHIVNAGFGYLVGSRTIQTIGALKIILQIATGAVYDCTGYDYELGAGGSLRMNETYGCGIWRKGFVLQGSTWVKCYGGVINYSNFDGSNGLGGRSVFFNSGAPAGYPASKPSVHWSAVSWYESTGGSNAAAIPSMYYGAWSPSGLTSSGIFFDYTGDGAGANAGFSGSFGEVEDTMLYKCIGGVGTDAGQ